MKYANLNMAIAVTLAVVVAPFDVPNAGHVAFPAGTVVFTRFVSPLTADSNGDIYAMKIDGTEFRRLTKDPYSNLHTDSIDASFSPGGDRIVFTSSRHDTANYYTDIYVMNSWDVNADYQGDLCTRLTFDNQNGYESGWPAWSPDGLKIAFVSSRMGPYELYLMDPDGSNQVRLIQSPTNDYEPSWSPDSKFIVFRRGDANRDVYKVEISTKAVAPLTSGQHKDQTPSWSVGNKVAFESYRDTNISSIYVMDPDGTNQVQLTDHPLSDHYPVWSPDAQHIVFHRRVGIGVRPPNNLFVIDADGSGPTNVSNAVVSDIADAWGPTYAEPTFPGTGDGSCDYLP